MSLRDYSGQVKHHYISFLPEIPKDLNYSLLSLCAHLLPPLLLTTCMSQIGGCIGTAAVSWDEFTSLAIVCVSFCLFLQLCGYQGGVESQEILYIQDFLNCHHHHQKEIQ